MGNRIDRLVQHFRAFILAHKGQYVGPAKLFSKYGVPLQPANGGVIAAGEYFVATPNPNSLDSRYAMTGNVKSVDVIGRTYEIF